MLIGYPKQRECSELGPRLTRSDSQALLPTDSIGCMTGLESLLLCIKKGCLLQHLSLLRMDFAQMSPVVPLPYPCSTRFTSNGSFSVTTAGPAYLSLHGDVPPDPQAWREAAVNLESSVSNVLLLQGVGYGYLLHLEPEKREDKYAESPRPTRIRLRSIETISDSRESGD